jgi:predicted  nucleic acid-binding Zn-ribbon protein
MDARQQFESLDQELQATKDVMKK